MGAAYLAEIKGRISAKVKAGLSLTWNRANGSHRMVQQEVIQSVSTVSIPLSHAHPTMSLTFRGSVKILREFYRMLKEILNKEGLSP